MGYNDIYLCEPEGQMLPFELSWRALRVDEERLNRLREVILDELLTLASTEREKEVISNVRKGTMKIPFEQEECELFGDNYRVLQCLDSLVRYPEMVVGALGDLQNAYTENGISPAQAQLKVVQMFLKYVGNRFSMTEYEDSDYELVVTLEPRTC